MSSKVRVYEVAKQLNLDPKQVVGLFQAIGVPEVRNHMSSVEPEAVERVKRHLEKQRTHDVVEERIRPTVVKRRAIAKASSVSAPQTDAASGPALPASPPSVRRLDDATLQAEVNGHTEGASGVPSRRGQHIVAEPPVGRDDAASPQPARGRNVDSGRLPIPEERKSGGVLDPAPVPRDRGSSRSVVPLEPAPTRALEVPPPPAERPTDDAAAAAAPAPVNEQSISPLPQLSNTVAPFPPAPSAAPPPIAASEPAPLPRTGQVPKTGVEYWTGRPGVPMPASGAASGPSSSRSAASQQPNMPRRVQYDPRAGAVGAPSARRDVRAPGQQPGRPMMGRSPGGAG
ncbi:MAG: translation initiation factor IF-2 N-terminal domain-containing protein, partial [Myxococcota bacterium]|nr:translation initiation factor IF-2 N-terminal domain-containing protein [Myxococcota bacterium]